jgi:bifunctional non-homologous end joining protein LigD
MLPAPQLATSSGTLTRDRDALMRSLQRRGWIAEPKLDGVRGMVVFDGAGHAAVLNRKRRDMSHRWPELVVSAPDLADVVLDGEIVVVVEEDVEEHGHDSVMTVDFPLTQRRDAQENPRDIAAFAATHPATFVCFDLIVGTGSASASKGRGSASTAYGGEDVRYRPYSERVALLDGLALPDHYVRMVRSPHVVDLWNAVVAAGGEGIVVKDPDGLYHGGRRREWVKFKQTHTISCLVTGWERGRGLRADTIGAVNLGLWDPVGGSVIPVGSVGTGWSGAELAALLVLVRAETPTVVDVEYHALMSGKLRHPVFRGIRTDVDLADCVVSQLAG